MSLQIKGMKKSQGTHFSGRLIDASKYSTRLTANEENQAKFNVPKQRRFTPLSITGENSIHVSKAQILSDHFTNKRIDTSNEGSRNVPTIQLSLDKSKARARMNLTFGYGKSSLLGSHVETESFNGSGMSPTEKEKSLFFLN